MSVRFMNESVNDQRKIGVGDILVPIYASVGKITYIEDNNYKIDFDYGDTVTTHFQTLKTNYHIFPLPAGNSTTEQIRHQLDTGKSVAIDKGLEYEIVTVVGNEDQYNIIKGEIVTNTYRYPEGLPADKKIIYIPNIVGKINLKKRKKSGKNKPRKKKSGKNKHRRKKSGKNKPRRKKSGKNKPRKKKSIRNNKKNSRK